MRIKGSMILAVIIAGAAGGWIYSGQVQDNPASASDKDAPIEIALEQGPVKVRVMDSEAQAYTSSIVASGQTQAFRSVSVRAETEGRIIKLAREKGELVKANMALAWIDKAARPARLERAKARVVQREIEYRAAATLTSRGYQAETKRAEAEANLIDAQSTVREIEVDLARTTISAPFSGVMSNRPVEIGDYLKVGDKIAEIVQLNPLLLTAFVTEREAPALEVGMPAEVRLATGQVLTGLVHYVSALANEATRTFMVEVEIDNPKNRIGQGVTGAISIPLPSVTAHLTSPSIFRLDAEGKIGLMIVDDQDKARFLPVQIIGTSDKGTWITGLPDKVRIISVGQELVEDGDTVIPVQTNAAS